jgi:hypothetical protein
LKDFGNTWSNAATNSASLYCNGTLFWGVIGSIADGSYANYYMPGERICITDLFLKNFIKMVISFEIYAGWMRNLHASIPNN